MPSFVQMYKSTDLNAPTLNGTAGSLINLLNRVLVNGYTTASIASLTQTGNVATATLAVANTTLVTGNWVRIAGADQSDYNGDFQITVVNSTTFTFIVANNPTSPATGTITYAKAPLGWTSPFSTTNIAAYRSTNTQSNRFYLRINETGSTVGGQKEAVATGFETMSDITTGTGQFPTTAQLSNGGLIWTKSITADSTNRAWCIIGDDKTFYIQIQNGSWTFLNGFGHFIPLKPGDGYNTFIGGQRTANTVSTNENTFSSWGSIETPTSAAGTYLSRSFTQIGTSCPAVNVSYDTSAMHSSNVYSYGPWNSACGTFYGTNNGPAFPNPADGGYYFLPIFVFECVTPYALRGRFPGFYHAWTGANPLTNYDEVTGFTNLPGAKLVALQCDAWNQYNSVMESGKVFINAAGPWT